MAKGTSDLRIVRANSVHVDAFCDVWLPDHEARRFAEPSTWDWEPFDWHVIILSTYASAAAIDPQGELEGLIAVEEPQVQAAPLLVHYLQCSPKNYGKNGARRGVGTSLLRWAVEQSQQLGHAGAVKLASTTEAEPFYDALKFVHTGSAPSGKKVYELRPAEVARFLSATTMRKVGP